MCSDDFEGELIAQDRASRQYQAELLRHPDPRDPDYPGDIEEDENDD